MFSEQSCSRLARGVCNTLKIMASEKEEFSCIFFLSFKGCFKGTKKRANSFMFLYSDPIRFMYFLAKEKYVGEMLSGGSVLLQADQDHLHQVWYQVFIDSIQCACELERDFALMQHLPKHCVIPSDRLCALAQPSCTISCVLWLTFSFLGCLVVLQLADCNLGSAQPPLWAAAEQ